MSCRGQRVILDSDLADLYGVTTKRLNEQVRRNRKKFPADFMFQLGAEERGFSLRSQNATLKRGRHRKYAPYVFTEHGAIQAANVLNSEKAVGMSVQVVRAFVELRRTLAQSAALNSKLGELERAVGVHDEQITAIVEAIRQLTAPEGPTHGRRIGFHPSRSEGRDA